MDGPERATSWMSRNWTKIRIVLGVTAIKMLLIPSYRCLPTMFATSACVLPVSPIALSSKGRYVASRISILSALCKFCRNRAGNVSVNFIVDCQSPPLLSGFFLARTLARFIHALSCDSSMSPVKREKFFLFQNIIPAIALHCFSLF